MYEPTLEIAVGSTLTQALSRAEVSAELYDVQIPTLADALAASDKEQGCALSMSDLLIEYLRNFSNGGLQKQIGHLETAINIIKEA